MISYRTFRNGDPPFLARVWNCQPPVPQRLTAMTSLLIDEHVLAKSYFDREGLIVASDETRIVGFAHAGFGPTADGSRLDTSIGSTLVLMIEPRPDASVIADELLARSERYLRGKGVQTLSAGMPSALAPFYWGLTGGCGTLGVMEPQEVFEQALRSAGYGQAARRAIYHRRLSSFRPAFDRAQVQWRRTTLAPLVVDCEFTSWWEASTLASTECWRANLKLPSAAPRAILRFWDLRPLTDSWGERGQGLLKFSCDDEAWRDGLAQFVWSESLTQMQQRGVTCVEASVDCDDQRFVALLKTLGCQEVAQSIVWKKPA